MAIIVKELSKKIKNTILVDTLELTIPDGSLFALLGKNGSGKSTVLRIIGGSLTADTGTTSTVRPCLSIMDFDRFFHFKLTGYENIRYYLSIFLQRKISKSHAIDTMTQFGLEAEHNKLFGTYSKGQKVRLAMSLMAVVKWKTLLLDEPTNGLDREGIDLLCDLLIKMKASKTAILIATHDQQFMQRVADSGVLFKENSKNITITPREINQTNQFEVDVVNENGEMSNNTWTNDDLNRFLNTGRGDFIKTIRRTSSAWTTL